MNNLSELREIRDKYENYQSLFVQNSYWDELIATVRSDIFQGFNTANQQDAMSYYYETQALNRILNKIQHTVDTYELAVEGTSPTNEY